MSHRRPGLLRKLRNGQKRARFCPEGRGWVRTSNMVQNGQKMPRIAQDSQERDWMAKYFFSLGRPRMAQDGPGWPRMDLDGPGWPRMAQDGPGWNRLDQDGPRLTRTAKIGTGWSRMVPRLFRMGHDGNPRPRMTKNGR